MSFSYVDPIESSLRGIWKLHKGDWTRKHTNAGLLWQLCRRPCDAMSSVPRSSTLHALASSGYFLHGLGQMLTFWQSVPEDKTLHVAGQNHVDHEILLCPRSVVLRRTFTLFYFARCPLHFTFKFTWMCLIQRLQFLCVYGATIPCDRFCFCWPVVRS